MQTTTFEHVVMSPDAYEAMKKDAARYRWIATHIGSARFTFRKDVQTLQSMTITCGFNVVSAKDAAIDSVIDEAIAED